MGNDKKKKGLDLRSKINSEKARKREIEKGMEFYKKSREEDDLFLV